MDFRRTKIENNGRFPTDPKSSGLYSYIMKGQSSLLRALIARTGEVSLTFLDGEVRRKCPRFVMVISVPRALIIPFTIKLHTLPIFLLLDRMPPHGLRSHIFLILTSGTGTHPWNTSSISKNRAFQYCQSMKKEA